MRATESKCAKAESIIRSIVGPTNVYQIPTDREHIWWLGKEANPRTFGKLSSVERRPTQQQRRSAGGGWGAAAPVSRDGWATRVGRGSGGGWRDGGQGRLGEGSARGSGQRSTERASDAKDAAASPKDRRQMSAECAYVKDSTMPYHVTVCVPGPRAVYALRSLHPDAAAHGKKAAPLLVNIVGQTGTGKSSISVQLIGETELRQCIKPSAKTKTQTTGGGEGLAGGVDVIHVFAATKKSASKALKLIYEHFKCTPVPELAALAVRAPNPPRHKGEERRQKAHAHEAEQQRIRVQGDFADAQATARRVNARREKEVAQFEARAKAEAGRQLRRDEQIAINMQFNARQQAKHRTGRSEQPDFAQRRMAPLAAAEHPPVGARSGAHPGARPGTSGSSSAANFGKVEWNCPACTFVNTSERNGARAICTMCCTSSAWSALQLAPSAAGGSMYQRQTSRREWDHEEDEIDLIPGGSDW